MPQISKKALSQFIRNECFRLLRLNLSPDTGLYNTERAAEGMPPIQRPRPGLEYLRLAGEEWQAEKLAELSLAMGHGLVIGDRYRNADGQERFRASNLGDYLTAAPRGSFLVEMEIEVGAAFTNGLNIANYQADYGLGFSRLRPDLIEVLSDATPFEKCVTPIGNMNWIEPNDTRTKLRIIDIKLTAEPSPSYFAEITYYSMALAGWLIDNNLHDQFMVVSNAAVWPGSHEASSLHQRFNEVAETGDRLEYTDAWNAMQDDLEEVPFEVFAARVKHFLLRDIPKALSAPWQEQPWFVDNRCKGCDYLGYPWVDHTGATTADRLHCMQEAARVNHLSRVAFVSRGATEALNGAGVANTVALAGLQPDALAFKTHHTLRATRNVITGRATSLQDQIATIPPQTGTSAIMPKYADLHIYVSVNFDLGSAITFAFGVKAFWYEPRQFGDTNPRDHHAFESRTFVNDLKDINSERRELIAFLNYINTIMTDSSRRNATTTVQLYIWDSTQYEHLTRILGRHLIAILTDPAIRNLAWLFPPEELLPNPDLETRSSPITILQNVVRAVVAAPIPHYYSLFQTARAYHHAGLPDQIAAFHVHPLFEDILSDQIPSERAHEIWARVADRRPWGEQLTTMQETVAKQLSALETITRRLEHDLRHTLQQTAPQISIQPPRRQLRISFDGQLWYSFARLNAVLAQLDIYKLRAMPPDEREARYRSARLMQRIAGADEIDALRTLGINPQAGMRVYRMQTESREVSAREGDFTFALAPEDAPGFLDRTLFSLIRQTPLANVYNEGWQQRIRMERATQVSIVAIDREENLIAIRSTDAFTSILDELELHRIADFSHNVILDPVPSDFFTSKLQRTLYAIGNPPNARDNPLVRRALGMDVQRRGRRTEVSPAGDLLWSADVLWDTVVARDIPNLRGFVEEQGVSLNESQWSAWESALSYRLSLIWGPPGTGKSRTLRAVAIGAVADALQRGTPLRLLVCANTYKAVDNVLLEASRTITEMAPDRTECIRLRSSFESPVVNAIGVVDLELDNWQPSANLENLRHRLDNNNGITVIGATPQQAHNLIKEGRDFRLREMFDFIIFDEASQADVGNAILPFAGLAAEGVVVVAGDPKQLPPIHKAQAPTGLEAMVGPVFTFFEEMHHIRPSILDVNYRSNQTIVELAYEAGYPRELNSHSPNLILQFTEELPDENAPNEWPDCLHWSQEWASLLDPTSSTSCFVYSDRSSSQWNQFEADSVAALTFLLRGRIASRLLNELDPQTGEALEPLEYPYSEEAFWESGIGIVTPHRAQQAMIVSRLEQILSPLGVSSRLIRGAVDTVERFQGQQRDVIIASFAIGDPDVIEDEDEFLMSLNRFNVMASRARAKLVVFVTQEVVNHLSKDVDVLRDSRLLKVFAESFCSNSRQMILGYRDLNGNVEVPGSYRWR